MNKKVILVDMDDVIENLVEAWIKEIDRRHGYHRDSEDITAWDMYKFYPDLEPNYIYEILDDPEFWKTVEPKKDAMEYIPKLQEYFEIYIVTAGLYLSIEAKISNIIYKYFPTIDNDHIIICHNKQMIKGDVIIDDGIHNLIGHDAIKLLYDTPHNREEDLPDDIYRVHNWEEIYNWLMGYNWLSGWRFGSGVDTCVICGRYVPEGTMVCSSCRNKIMNDSYKKERTHYWYVLQKDKICESNFDTSVSVYNSCWRCPLRNYNCSKLGPAEKELIDRWYNE